VSKDGIFGGTFNPIHKGHINSLLTVKSALRLDKIFIVPTYRTPLRNQEDYTSPRNRYEMVKLAIEHLGKEYVCSNVELLRKGISYTIDTIEELQRKNREDDFYLIIGADQFLEFEHWHQYGSILQKANLVVTSRPGNEVSSAVGAWPQKIASMVAHKKGDIIELMSGKKIVWVQLKDINVSASEIRRRLRTGAPVKEMLTKEVEHYISQHDLYRSRADRISDFSELLRFCAQALADKKAFDIMAKDMTGLTKPVEYTLVCSATSRKHAASLAENLMDSVKEQFNVYPQYMEGLDEGQWVVLDYGSLMVHIFYDFVRMEYKLEEIWKQAQDFKLELK